MLTRNHAKSSIRRSGPVLAVTAMLACSLCYAGSKPTKEKGEFRTNDLVEIVTLDPTIMLDIRYATSNNFTGKALYPEARAFLQREAALALVRVNAKIKKYGYGILVYDAYRPWSVTKKLWQITPQNKKMYVAKPKVGSRHNRGCAIDVSLYDLVTGKPMKMICEYDDMTERAHICYRGGTIDQQKLKYLLIIAMNEEGFMPFSREWWHFDYKGWKRYPVSDMPFSEL